MRSLTQGLSRGCSQAAGWGCSYTKAWLEQGNLLQRWLHHMAVGRRNQFFSTYTYLSTALLSVLITWRLASQRMGGLRKRASGKLQCYFWTYFEPPQMVLIRHFLYLTTETLTVIPITIASNPVEWNIIGELLCYVYSFYFPLRKCRNMKHI